MDLRDSLRYGLICLPQLFDQLRPIMKSFEQIKKEFNLLQTDFYRYLQLRHFLHKKDDLDQIKAPKEVGRLLFDLQINNTMDKTIAYMYGNNV